MESLVRNGNKSWEFNKLGRNWLIALQTDGRAGGEERLLFNLHSQQVVIGMIELFTFAFGFWGNWLYELSRVVLFKFFSMFIGCLLPTKELTFRYRLLYIVIEKVKQFQFNRNPRYYRKKSIFFITLNDGIVKGRRTRQKHHHQHEYSVSSTSCSSRRRQSLITVSTTSFSTLSSSSSLS